MIKPHPFNLLIPNKLNGELCIAGFWWKVELDKGRGGIGRPQAQTCCCGQQASFIHNNMEYAKLILF